MKKRFLLIILLWSFYIVHGDRYVYTTVHYLNDTINFSEFTGCTALETNAKGLLLCGSDAGQAGGNTTEEIQAAVNTSIY